jgi:hypothetical protein
VDGLRSGEQGARASKRPRSTGSVEELAAQAELSTDPPAQQRPMSRHSQAREDTVRPGTGARSEAEIIPTQTAYGVSLLASDARTASGTIMRAETWNAFARGITSAAPAANEVFSQLQVEPPAESSSKAPAKKKRRRRR